MSSETVSTSVLETKDLLCDVCHRMWEQGWVASNDGNVSALLCDGRILCTPTGVSKREISPEMLLIVDRSGHCLEGSGRPSTELAMHLRCYDERDDVRAVIHTHAPYSTAFAVANRALDDYAMIESVLVLGAVPVAPYAAPGSGEVPESIAPFLPKHDAVLLRAHGALTVGCDLMTAYYRMETLEHVARISLLARLLGGAVDLPRDAIDSLCECRKTFYHQTGRHPGYVKFNGD